MRSKTRSGKKSGQMQHELDGMIDQFVSRGVTRYMEVGARYGDTFYDVMRALPSGSRGVVVDMPSGYWGSSDTLPHLRDACEALESDGYDIKLILGDSTSEEIIRQVAALGPYHACLIDGDHRYDGCMADWVNYSTMCEMVAFHDIVGHGQRHGPGVNVEVPRVWQEVRGPRCVEIVAPKSTMGIGITWTTS